MEKRILKIITDYVAAYPLQHKRVDAWQQPLVGFSRADDEFFTKLKEVVSPTHATPVELFAKARSVIVYFLPFIKEIPKSNKNGQTASTEWASAYVETNKMIVALNQHLKAFLADQGYESRLLPPTHNFDPQSLISDWSHKHVAYIAGLGDFGYHHQLITEKGVGGRLGSLITEAPLKPTLRSGATFCLNRFDGSCQVCRRRCPVDALKKEKLGRHECYDLLLKNAELYAHLGLADVCGKCVSIVPCSFLNPVVKKAQRLVRTQLSLEKAEEHDLPAILKLQKTAYQSEADRYSDPNIPPMTQTLNDIRQEFADQLFLKAVVGNRIIGSVRLAEKDGQGFIGKLIVHPDFQRHGVGRHLMSEIESIATPVDRFELFTGHQSTKPLNLYASMGYHEFNRKSLDTHTLVFLEKANYNK